VADSLHQFLSETAILAGERALRGFGRFDVSLKTDGTEITETDAAVERLIRDRIAEAFPDDVFLGEETSAEDEFLALIQHPKRRCWVVDPIDGTASFARGLPVWGVSIAIIAGGAVEAGCFHNPLTREMFVTTDQDSATFNGAHISCTEKQQLDRDDLMLVLSRFHSKYRSDFPGKTRSLGSTASHLCYLANGAAAAVLLDGVGLWDIAAGFEIARRAGACFRYLDGSHCQLEDYFTNKRNMRPAVATTPALAAEVIAHIQRA